jgi:hypothetical protein
LSRCSPQEAATPPPPAPLAQEQRWQLTAASLDEQLAALTLGVLNLAGVMALTFALRDPANQQTLAHNGLQGVLGLMPWLQAYAAAFFAIPAVRWKFTGAANVAIDARNAAREEAARLLAEPDPQLQRKLAAAQRAAARKMVRDQDIVYRSDRPLEAQPVDVEARALRLGWSGARETASSSSSSSKGSRRRERRSRGRSRRSGGWTSGRSATAAN